MSESQFKKSKKSFKYFIGYKDDKKVRLLFAMLLKMSAYRRVFDENKYISFLIKNDELLVKYEFWDKVPNTIKKGNDSEHLRTKMKSYVGKISTNFHGDRIPKEGSQCICLSVIWIGSVIKTGKNYFLQVCLEQCKHVLKEKKGA